MLNSKQHQIAEAEKLPIPTVQAIIDGKPSGSASGKTLAVVSPINGDTIAAIPDCEAVDIDRAAAGARHTNGAQPLCRAGAMPSDQFYPLIHLKGGPHRRVLSIQTC